MQRGNPRFKGSGSQWKSSWRGKTPFTEMCWFTGMGQNITQNFYVDPAGALPLDPVAGFYVAAVVGLSQNPLVSATIAANGGANQGWELRVLQETPGAEGEPRVRFDFVVYDGAGIAAQASAGPLSIFLDPNMGIDHVLFRVMAWFRGSGAGNPNGAIQIKVESQGSLEVPLGSPYSNPAPSLVVGASTNGITVFTPNTIHGVVGGDGIPVGTSVVDMNAIAKSWIASVRDEFQLTIPDGGVLVPTLAPLDGWRANNPKLAPPLAPDPLSPFVGTTQLQAAFVGSPHSPIGVGCSQPSVFGSPA